MKKQVRVINPVSYTHLDVYKRQVYAFANATVPKVNILIGNAMGSAYVAMNSKAIGADVVYAWPTAKVGMMDAKSAVQIMYADEIEKADEMCIRDRN